MLSISDPLESCIPYFIVLLVLLTGYLAWKRAQEIHPAQTWASVCRTLGILVTIWVVGICCYTLFCLAYLRIVLPANHYNLLEFATPENLIEVFCCFLYLWGAISLARITLMHRQKSRWWIFWGLVVGMVASLLLLFGTFIIEFCRWTNWNNTLDFHVLFQFIVEELRSLFETQERLPWWAWYAFIFRDWLFKMMLLLSAAVYATAAWYVLIRRRTLPGSLGDHA